VKVVALASALMLAVSLHAQRSSDAPLVAAEAFRARLVTALDGNQRRQVAAMFQYPIRVTVPALPYPIPVDDAAAMVKMYDLFFTPEMRCAIEESRVRRDGGAKPKYAMLVAEGVVSLADGRMVAERTASGLRITRLQVTGSGGPPAGRREKVGFRWGTGETQYAGRLSGNGVDGYTVVARKGDLLQVRIERFPGRSLQLRVTAEKTGQVMLGAQSEFARLWAARLPEAGDYRVDVVRRAAYCDPSITYVLTLALRR
jgi:hypothetical protein